MAALINDVGNFSWSRIFGQLWTDFASLPVGWLNFRQFGNQVGRRTSTYAHSLCMFIVCLCVCVYVYLSVEPLARSLQTRSCVCVLYGRSTNRVPLVQWQQLYCIQYCSAVFASNDGSRQRRPSNNDNE